VRGDEALYSPARPSSKGRKMPGFLKTLSNVGEARTDELLSPCVIRHGGIIYRKPRIADVVNVKGLGSRDLHGLGFAGHFDFVVADEGHIPQFAVEFDGPGHDAKRDPQKDDICRRAGLALFRVSPPSSFFEIKPASFVGYLVHTWFFLQEFLRMQANGEIPAEEPFMMSGFLRPDAKNVFDSEFDFVRAARGRLTKLVVDIREDRTHASISMIGPNGEYAAFAQNGKFYGRSRLVFRAVTWGAFENYAPALARELSEFCHALAYRDLCREIKDTRVDPHVRRRAHEVRQEIAALREQGFETMR
jgi:hypothetical protein